MPGPAVGGDPSPGRPWFLTPGRRGQEAGGRGCVESQALPQKQGQLGSRGGLCPWRLLPWCFCTAPARPVPGESVGHTLYVCHGRICAVSPQREMHGKNWKETGQNLWAPSRWAGFEVERGGLVQESGIQKKGRKAVWRLPGEGGDARGNVFVWLHAGSTFGR